MTVLGAAVLIIAGLALTIACGVQIAVALSAVSIAAVYAATGEWQAVTQMIVTVTRDGLRAEVFIAIPLFMIMGEFIGRSGAAIDTFRLVSYALHRVPAGAALAGVAGAALSSFAAGSSIAGTAGFAALGHSQMRSGGIDRAVSLATLASGSALGMLLPPSVLMVTWGTLGGQPVGAILLAAVVPALLIVIGFAGSALVGASSPSMPSSLPPLPSQLPSRAWMSAAGMVLIFVAVLGGIGTQLLSPAEAVSLGAAISLAMALAKGMRAGAIIDAILAAGRASAPILLLVFAALIYAQALSATGAGRALADSLAALGPAAALATMVIIWLALIVILDSFSALALTAAIFVPAATMLGFDPLAFAIIGIIVLEAAPLVPPLGLLVFAAKGAAGEADGGVGVFDVFAAVLPYLAVLLAVIALVVIFPAIATWLPHLAP